MSYIGKEPIVGNFQKCDAITTSSTATYNLTVSSVAVFPETTNNCIVSLNGVIQAPTSAYTISGSQIVFASSLTSSDVIDFILILGSVLNVGTVSDATITDAKANFVSTSSAAGLQIKGDGTTDGTLQLNCSQNSHGIKLKSPAHSAGASYTLTFPVNDGDANQFLQTNGSGVLSFADAGGGTLTAKQATTSGSSVDFTGIPAGTKWITVLFNSMGSNGTGLFGIQLGDSGGIETSGYLGNLSGINSGTSGQRAIYASQFVIVNPAISAEAYAGIVHLRLFESSSYTWSMSSVMADEGGGQTNFFGAGQKSLSAELTQIRVMTANTFDEGNVSIQYGE